jgi:hypothetical protein
MLAVGCKPSNRLPLLLDEAEALRPNTQMSLLYSPITASSFAKVRPIERAESLRGDSSQVIYI